ncbi:MAG: hypothetical protein NTV05_05190 [Acidobacteria bacterium]|nr:hypothetical protein [Acidobacteriota bacterium]
MKTKTPTRTTPAAEPIEFDADDARHCLTVAIGLCEMASEIVEPVGPGDRNHALSSDLFQAMTCLLMKAQDAFDNDVAPSATDAAAGGAR